MGWRRSSGTHPKAESPAEAKPLHNNIDWESPCTCQSIQTAAGRLRLDLTIRSAALTATIGHALVRGNAGARLLAARPARLPRSAVNNGSGWVRLNAGFSFMAMTLILTVL